MSKICEHIREDGNRCSSPALYQRDYCYFHWRLYMLQRAADESLCQPPVLDSEAGLQLAAAQVFRSLASGKLDPYRAQTMLASLNLIAKSVRANEDLGPGKDALARELTPAMEKQLATPPPLPALPEKKGPASIEEIFSSGRRS